MTFNRHSSDISCFNDEINLEGAHFGFNIIICLLIVWLRRKGLITPTHQLAFESNTWPARPSYPHYWNKCRVYGWLTLTLILTIWGLYSLRSRSRDSSVGISTAYGLDDREVEIRVPVGSRIFSYLRCPDRLWGPPNLLSNGIFPRE
jgi:hypothetical protein